MPHVSIYNDDSSEYYEEEMILTASYYTLSIPRLGRGNPDSRVEVSRDTAEAAAGELFAKYPHIDAILLYAVRTDTQRQAQVATILPNGAKPKNFPGKIKPRQWAVGNSDVWWTLGSTPT